MAKLSKTEISVLANKIARELNAPREQKYKETQELLVEQKRKDKRHIDFCKLFGHDARSVVIREIDYYQRAAYHQLFDGEYEAERYEKVSTSVIEEEIIIANIDCPNIDELIEKVKQKFS
jgi:hypothetical protein